MGLKTYTTHHPCKRRLRAIKDIQLTVHEVWTTVKNYMYVESSHIALFVLKVFVPISLLSHQIFLVVL